MKRPSETDEYVIKMAVGQLADRYLALGLDSDSNREDIEEDLTAALRKRPRSGFEMCKELDHMGWEIDDQMVESLNADYVLLEAVKHMTRQWVEAEKIQCRHVVGDTVTYHGEQGSTIEAVHPKTAEYLVRTPTLAKRVGPGGGYVVACELVDGQEAP